MEGRGYNMILEVAMLSIRPGRSNEFEDAFKVASKIISSVEGYIDHSLKRCIEDANKYILLVHWDKLESHTVTFRTSDKYLEWKGLLHHFYDPFPSVDHFEDL